jgi:hypothetical protein
MFSRSERPSGKVKDTCWACSRPVYESDPAVYYLGLWVHASCYHEGNIFAEDEDSDTGGTGGIDAGPR